MKPSHLLCIGLAIPVLLAAAQQGQPDRPAKPQQPDKIGQPDKVTQPKDSMARTMEDPIFRDSLAAQEKLMWEAVKSQNWSSFESQLSDSFLGICPTGFQNKSQVMTEIKKGKVNSYTLGDWHALKLSETAGIVMYRAECDGASPDGKPMKGTYYCSTTWTKRGEKWQSESHTATMQDDGMAKDK